MARGRETDRNLDRQTDKERERGGGGAEGGRQTDYERQRESE